MYLLLAYMGPPSREKKVASIAMVHTIVLYARIIE